jgi:glucose/arabinose dehydrogenase
MLFQGVRQGVFLALVSFGLVATEAALKVELLVGGLSRPLFVCSPPGDSNRLFIVEQHVSRIRIFNRTNSTLLPTAFLTITGVRRGGEQGMLGLAFHPGYETNGFFYVNLNPSDSPNRTEIRRYKVQGDPQTSNVADPASMKVILTYAQPESNHNGGWMGFGQDGYLYISSGDGGGGNDVHGTIGNGQDRTTLLGKILRIDPSITEEADPAYTIPDGNPYKGSLSMRNEIWAFGLRNPWRCSIDRETGDLWIGDVGQGAREEIDFNPAGEGGLNFGWRPREGFISTPGINETPVTTATDPIFDYERSLGRSVTGGYVYRGEAIAELKGKYIFADYLSARFWVTYPTRIATQGEGATTEITADINPNGTAVTGISSFGEDAQGELYVCALDTGRVYKILAEGPVAARISAVERDGENLVLSFVAAPNQAYTLEGSSVLGEGSNWVSVEEVPSGATSRTVDITIPVTGDARFFRVSAL